MAPRADAAGEWMTKAKEDLESARVLLGHDPPLKAPACFHCQQAAEKALKGFLVFRGVEFELVHNLEYLLNLCEGEGAPFGDLHDEADALAPFAIDIRYPGGMEVSTEEAKAVLSAAETICEAVKRLLPEHER